ncbi:Protein phosphatase 2C [Desulfuromusa kysingii]|uniref:Protein phosphatase 2C n=1 Tax=Desulfuromusa kysingii TaxID=37625 RepID=A0A1H3W4J9_9BACT|nr:protein phosphatase 2C domain-containing protein [Desulfuromusa kysingii]SDZ81771.1 Protein phosphatase 2C [Desulfuromusa kysingii]
MQRKIKHIERILDQGSGRLNEDKLVCANNLFAVFDGASSLVPDLYSGKTGAWWASHLVSTTFFQNDASLFSLGQRANEILQKTMTEMGIESRDKLKRWSTSVAAFQIQEDTIAWLQSGDSQVLAIDADGGFQLLTPYHNHDKETLQLLKQLFQQGDPDPHKSLRPQVENVRRRMNQDYGVLNGEPVALDFLQLGATDLRGISHLLVFTDGLFPPSEDPESQPDFRWITDHFLQGGLRQVKEQIRAQEENDPDCQRYPRFKQHDDIAAIAVSFDH